MEIHHIESSNVTESGNIIKPVSRINNDKRKFYTKSSFWGGVGTGVVASMIFEYIVKPLLS